MANPNLPSSVREATPGDIRLIVNLGERMHDQTGFSYPYEADAVAQVAREMIEDPDALMLVTERGYICGRKTSCFYGTVIAGAVIQSWYAEDGKFWHLLDGFRAWAAPLKVSTSIPRTRRQKAILRGLRMRGFDMSDVVMEG